MMCVTNQSNAKMSSIQRYIHAYMCIYVATLLPNAVTFKHHNSIHLLMIDTTTISQLVTIWMSSFISDTTSFPWSHFYYIDNSLKLYDSIAVR